MRWLTQNISWYKNQAKNESWNGLNWYFRKDAHQKSEGVSAVRLKKLDSFTLETSKNHLIRNFLRNGLVRVKWYILRVQLFGGELRKCNDFTIHSEENCTGHFYQRILVSSELNLDDKYSEPRQLWVPRVYANPRNFDFDTMSNAILTLFEVLSLKGWIEVRDVMINRIQEKSFLNSYFLGN